MLTLVENCARTPPMLLPVEPLPCELSRSITKTLLHPAAVRCQAILDPTIPPPTMTTSAVCMLHHVYDNCAFEVYAKNERRTRAPRGASEDSPARSSALFSI